MLHFDTVELLQPTLNTAEINIYAISSVTVSDIFIAIPAHFICVSFGLVSALISGVAVRQVFIPRIKRKQTFSRRSSVTRGSWMAGQLVSRARNRTTMIQLYQVSGREEKSHLRTHREAEGKDSQKRKTLVWAVQCGAALAGGESEAEQIIQIATIPASLHEATHPNVS